VIEAGSRFSRSWGPNLAKVARPACRVRLPQNVVKARNLRKAADRH
jgi:hypothetical protein